MQVAPVGQAEVAGCVGGHPDRPGPSVDARFGQRAQDVGGQGQSRADLTRFGCALQHGGLPADPAQGNRRGQPANAAADHDRVSGHVVFSPFGSAERRGGALSNTAAIHSKVA